MSSNSDSGFEIGSLDEALRDVVVLRTELVGESDVLLSLLSAEGKMLAVARGARRSKKRFTGGLTTGVVGQMEFGRVRGQRVDVVAFFPDARHRRLAADLTAFAYAHYLCELADVFLYPEIPTPDVFEVLSAAMIHLYEVGGHPLLLRHFEFVVLGHLGLLPEFEVCAVCGRLPSDRGGRVAFDGARGGVLCLDHAGASTMYPVAAMALATNLLHNGFGELLHSYDQLSADLRKCLKLLAYGSLAQHLPRALRSLGPLGALASRS